MKKKVLATLLSVAMVATLLAGCGAAAPAEEAAAPAATEEAAPAEDAAAEEPAAEEAAAPAGDMKFEIVSKGFQHQYWQAVLV